MLDDKLIFLLCSTYLLFHFFFIYNLEKIIYKLFDYTYSGASSVHAVHALVTNRSGFLFTIYCLPENCIQYLLFRLNNNMNEADYLVKNYFFFFLNLISSIDVLLLSFFLYDYYNIESYNKTFFLFFNTPP